MTKDEMIEALEMGRNYCYDEVASAKIRSVIIALREIKSEPIYQVASSTDDCCWNDCPKTFYDEWHEEKRILYTAPPELISKVKVEFDCFSSDEGDTWFDCPDDLEIIYDTLGDYPKVGDIYTVQASIRATEVKFRITKIPDDVSDDYEVEAVDDAAPQPESK